MSDYISKDALLEIVGKMPIDWEYGKAVSDIYDIIKEQPTVDEKEIIRKTVERIVDIVEDYTEDAEHYGFASAIADMVEAIKEEGGLNDSTKSD